MGPNQTYKLLHGKEKKDKLQNGRKYLQVIDRQEFNLQNI